MSPLNDESQHDDDQDRIGKQGLQVPLTDEALRKIIEEQCRLTGWKVPPTIQVARAVERAHGIGSDERR